MPERMSHVYAKICGLRDPDHARVAIEAGAHAVGVVMNRTSARRATEEEARTVIEAVDGRADTVLVVNDMPVAQAAALARRLEFDVLQLHGSAYGAADFEVALKKVDRVWRATSIDLLSSLQVGAYGEEHLLLDAPKPGSGERWDASALATDGPQGEWLLAGGLAPDNVAEIIRTVRPWGVDVSSGVEVAPGEKSVQLIREFLAAVAV